ncbi:MAG: hypothetical protein ACXAEN_22955 [Candidatus Thorarchaeota archaeon]
MDSKVIERLPYWGTWAIVCLLFAKFTPIGGWAAFAFFFGYYYILDEKPPFLRP